MTNLEPAVLEGRTLCSDYVEPLVDIPPKRQTTVNQTQKFYNTIHFAGVTILQPFKQLNTHLPNS